MTLSLSTLCELFPSLPSSTIEAALKRHGNDPDAAAAALLQKQQTIDPQGSRRLQQRSSSWGALGNAGRPQRSASWGSLSEASQHQRQLPIAGLQFKPAGRPTARAQPQLRPADFPAVAAAATGSPAAPAGVAPAWQQAQVQPCSQRQARRQHPQQQQQQQQRQQQQQQGQQQQQQQQQQQWRRREQPGPPAQAAVHCLLELHGWAGRELVEAVLEAAGGSADAAAAILEDMVAPPHPGPASQPSGLDASAAATAAAAPAGTDAPTRQQPGQQQPGQQQPEQQPCSTGARGGRSPAVPASSGSGSDDEAADPYYRHRRRALQLTRRWQRAARGTAAAYAAGRHSEARQLAAEAQRWRREALAAHAQAADRIETENNSGGSLFELDLHGLHAHEATAALDRRLALLRSLLADPPTAAAAAAAAAGGSAGAGAAAGGRPRLRVIVGRGAHSSGGEASLPRAVENHLKAAGLRYDLRLGALDVPLRAPAAAAAAAAGRAAV